MSTSRLRHAAEDAKNGDKRGGGQGGGAAVLILQLAVDECRNEMMDRVARYRVD